MAANTEPICLNGIMTVGTVCSLCNLKDSWDNILEMEELSGLNKTPNHLLDRVNVMTLPEVVSDVKTVAVYSLS